MPRGRDELREQLLSAVERASPASIALIVTRLLSRIPDAEAAEVVTGLSAELGDLEDEPAYDPVAAGKEMAKQQIGDRERSRDAFR